MTGYQIDDISHWAVAIATLLNAASVIVVWLIRRSIGSRQEQVEMEKRVAAIEQSSRGAPGWQVMDDIRTRLSGMEGDLKGVRVTLEERVDQEKHLRASLDSIQRYLLERPIS